MDCPCCSGKSYAECCKIYHDGSLPPTPLALMRSRYSAYALGKVDYIVATTHPDSPFFEKDLKKWKQGIAEFSQTTKFLKLEIVAFGEDWVHFKAHLNRGLLEEKSHFSQIGEKWLYVKPLVIQESVLPPPYPKE